MKDLGKSLETSYAIPLKDEPEMTRNPSQKFTTKARRHQEKRKDKSETLCALVVDEMTSEAISEIHHKGTKAPRKAKGINETLGVFVPLWLEPISEIHHKGTKAPRKAGNVNQKTFVSLCLGGL